MKVLNANFFLLVVGIGLVGASLLADVIPGIGDDAGFGPQQTIGTIAGAVIAAVGLYLSLGVNAGRSRATPSGQTRATLSDQSRP